MKVEDRRWQRKSKAFTNVKIGECFELEDDVFIKTGEDAYPQAVSIFSGKCFQFGKYVDVKPLDAKVVIE